MPSSLFLKDAHPRAGGFRTSSQTLSFFLSYYCTHTLGNVFLHLILFLLLGPVRIGSAQTNFYQFNINQDRLHGAVDFSFLNHPLQPADRLVSRQGHFYRVGADLLPNTADDERVRLFGVNLAFGANFPEGADAARIAKRLRILGVNLVRLHHMDSSPDSIPTNASSLLTTQPYPALNPYSVPLLRNLLDALKAEGIYADLNLHVGYQFRPSIDNVPALPGGQAFPDQSKPLHMLFPRMIDLQAQYVQSILESLNLKDDPVLGVVEINNESSLMDAWQGGSLDQYLTGDYQAEFKNQWNRFLVQKYPSDEALQAAWGDTEPNGPNLLTSIPWSPLEIHSGAQATTGTQAGEPGTQWVKVTNGSTVVILKKVGFEVKAGQSYQAEVEIRTDHAAGQTGNIYWDVKRDVSPWDQAASKSITVNNTWKTFTLAVIPKTDFAAGQGRFGLSVEGIVGTNIYVRNAKFYIAGKQGYPPGGSLAAGNLPLVASGEIATDGRSNDYLIFLADRDRYFLGRLLEVVKGKSNPLVPVTGTQMNFGGLMNLDSHIDMDYQDSHFYVDHYGFPGTPWDDRDWTITDQSAVGSGLWNFHNLAFAREAGKPYTVSEFNQPWPNTYAAECDLTLGAFGAFQDWDSIMHFAYSHSKSWDMGTPDGFNLNGDWTKFPVAGQAAWLFRSGAIRPGLTPVSIPVTEDLRLKAQRSRWNGNFSDFFQTVLPCDPNLAFSYRIELKRDGAGPLPEPCQETLSSPYVSESGEITYDSSRKLFLVHAPAVAGVVGFIGNPGKMASGGMEVESAGTARGFVSTTVNSLDGRPLNKSAHLLLSNPGYTLPSQAGVTPATIQPLVHYKSDPSRWTLQPENGSSKPSGRLSGGALPNWMERIELQISLRTAASSLTVYPLNGEGARMTPLASEDVVKIVDGFKIHLQSAAQAAGGILSPWYELVADGVPEEASRGIVVDQSQKRIVESQQETLSRHH